MADSQRRSGDEQPLRDPERGAADSGSADRSMPCLTLFGFLFLTINSVMAVYRSQGDVPAVMFVAASYADLVLLFACLRFYQRATPDSSTRTRLKIAVWTLTTLLTLAFAYRLSSVMPLPMAALVCAMAAVALVGIYNAFFAHRAH
ncbi:unnamed protein product [Urochloa decumbens]|uniref:Uncharacterized protein n=1 Tax=Urochloa decumbens TaxID=240449 RepID=A0ABC9CND4_9POAL